MQNHRISLLYLFLSLFLALLASPAGASLMGGSLTWGEGDEGALYATDGWANTSTSLTWIVTPNPDGSWHYSYTWYTSGKAMSHMIIEVSPGFPTGDLDVSASSGITVEGSVGNYVVGPDNPGLPGDLYGLKFEAFNPEGGKVDLGNVTLEFDTLLAPMWGDFYAKDGKEQGQWVYAYNTDFMDVLTDAEKYASSAPGWFIAVPGPFEGTPYYVPLPASILLGVVAVGLAGRKLRQFV